ncbi:tRNA preQ1(34) S-adenosylmethionine ribosyltransferase-isomerase QueA [Candidatus Latescibacterota bacterium]
MIINDYDYELPADLIAQEPTSERDLSRLLVLDLDTDSTDHRKFSDLPDFLHKNDILVINDTKVFPARLIGTKESTGGEVELFLLKSLGNGMWDALARPSRRLNRGSVIVFDEGILRAIIIEKGMDGHVQAKLESEIDHETAIDSVGKTPLPPYIKRYPVKSDRERYQTVYAQIRGSVAAPTAGLHFSNRLLDKLASRNNTVASVTLHVGIGTFRPLSHEEAQKESLHSEYCRVPESTVTMIDRCRQKGGQVFAVGTTTARALETASNGSKLENYEGWTDIFIKPPYSFKSVDALITNFHLPRSSLLMMVSAFAGRERILKAYEEAIKMRYRFYSYGDAMLIMWRKR